jgi:DtxR family Mn-dependent transcriptional regulator
MKKSPTLLTSTKEDYVRAIYKIALHGGDIGVTQIAEKLKLSKSTVSERLKELEREGFVVAKPYSSISLTEAGLEAGEKLTYKHRIIEVFLHDVLKIPAAEVHVEAEKLEHACSDEVIKKLAEFLGNPKTDPHGSEIKQIKNW